MFEFWADETEKFILLSGNIIHIPSSEDYVVKGVLGI